MKELQIAGDSHRRYNNWGGGAGAPPVVERSGRNVTWGSWAGPFVLDIAQTPFIQLGCGRPRVPATSAY